MTVSDALPSDPAPVSSLDIWGYRVAASGLNAETRQYLGGLPRERPDVAWLWHEMDRIWDETTRQPDCAADRALFFRTYYSHPVWLLNGIFTATDPDSIFHRDAIAAYVASLEPGHVVDYGGGFGELARHLARHLSGRRPDSRIDILEPFPSTVGRAAVAELPSVRFVADFGEPCDVMIAQDVLEHVDEPVALAQRMAEATKPGGILIFANSFWPVIHCHLPKTFYLRPSFRYVMRGLGLTFVGTVPGVPHAEIFQRGDSLDPAACRRYDRLARLLCGPGVALKDHYRAFRRWARR